MKYDQKRLCALLSMTVLMYLSLSVVILKKCCYIFGLNKVNNRTNNEFEQQSMLNTVSMNRVWWHRLARLFFPLKPGSNRGVNSHIAFQGDQWAVSPTII